MEYYTYDEYNNFNRFINLDGIEPKIIEHLVYGESKYCQNIWKLLKYSSKDALWKETPTVAERQALIEAGTPSAESSDTKHARIFLRPFSDDAVTEECSFLYIYVGDIQPLDATQSVVDVSVEVITHNHSNTIMSEADFIAHPDETNPNDYYISDEVPAVQYKSRETVLVKSILAELNGLYIDGAGYLQFNTRQHTSGRNVDSKVGLSIYNGQSFFGHRIQFTVIMSGVSDNSDIGY